MIRFDINGDTETPDQFTLQRQMLTDICADFNMLTEQPVAAIEEFKRLANSGPGLSDWSYAMRYMPVLVGYAKGHPVLQGDRRLITTSRLWMHCEELGLARTESRWYRLKHPRISGEPYDDPDFMRIN